MKYPAIRVAIGLGAAILSFSCAEQSSVLKPSPTAATVTEKGKIVPSDTEFEGTIGRIDAEAGLITVQHWPLSKTFKSYAGLSDRHFDECECRAGGVEGRGCRGRNLCGSRERTSSPAESSARGARRMIVSKRKRWSASTKC